MKPPRLKFTLRAIVSRTSDGNGFLVDMPELHLSTWVKSIEDLDAEIESLLRGFFRAERARGTLGNTVRGLLENSEVPLPRGAVPPDQLIEPVIFTDLHVGGAVPARELQLTL